jgi:hypothetical protein
MPRKQPRHFRERVQIARLFVFLFAIARAATAATGLYVLGHNAMGIAAHSIMIGSFGAAGFLIVVYAAMTFIGNTR